MHSILFHFDKAYVSATNLHKGAAAKSARKVFYWEINFASFARLR